MTGKKEKIHSSTEQTFMNYFVCDENQVACAAARSMARNPGTNFNPFCICGCSGAGKTHLLYAIINEINIYHPELKAVYVTKKNFTDDYIRSNKNRYTDELYDSYYESDILLIDDFDSFFNVPVMNNELLNLINSLLSQNKQVVLTASQVQLENRLKSDDTWTYLAYLSLPCQNSRLGYLHFLTERGSITYPEETLNYLAEVLSSNYNIISNVIKQIEISSALSGIIPGIETIKQLLKDLGIMTIEQLFLIC